MSKGYLIDMDGVIYSGMDLISGADEFIERLKEKDIPFLFLTNNSQRSRLDVVNKLAGLGIGAEEKNVFTSAMATARLPLRILINWPSKGFNSIVPICQRRFVRQRALR